MPNKFVFTLDLFVSLSVDMIKYLYYILLFGLGVVNVMAAPVDSTLVQQQSSAWRVLQPLGTRVEATVDTLHTNYAQEFVPSEISDAWYMPVTIVPKVII